MVPAPGNEWTRQPPPRPESNGNELDGEALERSILERDWEIGLRRNVVWIATQVRYFFAETEGRSPHAALAESYRHALAWAAAQASGPDRIRNLA